VIMRENLWRGSNRYCGAAGRPLAHAGQPPHAMVEDGYVRNYRPLFVIDQYGVMQYVDAPLLAVALDREPSAALKLAVEPGLISSSN
jgi:hypothetical protein